MCSLDYLIIPLLSWVRNYFFSYLESFLRMQGSVVIKHCMLLATCAVDFCVALHA